MEMNFFFSLHWTITRRIQLYGPEILLCGSAVLIFSKIRRLFEGHQWSWKRGRISCDSSAVKRWAVWFICWVLEIQTRKLWFQFNISFVLPCFSVLLFDPIVNGQPEAMLHPDAYKNYVCPTDWSQGLDQVEQVEQVEVVLKCLEVCRQCSSLVGGGVFNAKTYGVSWQRNLMKTMPLFLLSKEV